MTEIEVNQLDERDFSVTLTDQDSTSTHRVTVDPADLVRLGDGSSGSELVAASFRFLLDREPKESIMSSFDLSIISRYFPEYPSRIGDYL